MAFESPLKDRFLAPLTLAPAAPSPEHRSSVEPGNSGRRHANIYDAVAGRVSAAGFIPSAPHPSTPHILPHASASVPPEAVLLRRANAPLRYEESDPYFASDDLPHSTLPDSDLLKAIHTYVSDYYGATLNDNKRTLPDWKSMDETALLALGILMEELCQEALGQTGDLVFTESLNNGQQSDGRERSVSKARSTTKEAERKKSRSKMRSRSRSKKRRRIEQESEAD